MENAFLITPEQTQVLSEKIAFAVIEALRQKEQNLNTSPTNNLTMTREEVCKYLGIGATTLWSWQKSNKLVPIRLGRKLYYKSDDVARLLTDKSM